MRVSVIIPTYNRAGLLREALQGVFAQTFRDLEVLVVDDGSTEDIGAVIREFGGRAILLQSGHRGISTARNTGLERAAGEFVAFLDSDDLWQPEKLSRHLAFADSHPEALLTYTDAEEFNEAGTLHPSYVALSPELRNPDHLFEAMIRRFAFPLTSATMIRTAALKECGLRFMDDVHIGEDLGLFLELMLHGGRFAYLPEPLTRRRMHAANVSADHRLRFSQRLLLYSKLLQRYGTTARPAWREALEWGRREAEFRLGECCWADFEMRAARSHFRASWGADARGLKAAAYSLVSLLPAGWIARARAAKRRLAGGPG